MERPDAEGRAGSGCRARAAFPLATAPTEGSPAVPPSGEFSGRPKDAAAQPPAEATNAIPQPPVQTTPSMPSGDSPRTAAIEAGASTQTQARAAWDACLAPADILQRAAREQKLAACTEALAQSPAQPDSRREEALKQRALAYAVTDRSLAIADYSAALEIDAKDIDSLLARGALYLKEAGFGDERGRYDLSVADFNQAIALDPRNAQAFIHRGDAHRATHGTSLAEQDYRRALELDPASQAAKTRLETSRQDLEPQKEKNEDYEACVDRSLDADRRIEACSKFIATTPDFYNSSSRMLLASTGDKSDHSLAALNKSIGAIALGSDIDLGMADRGFAFAFRALAYHDKGDLENTLVDLNYAIDRAPIMIYRNGEASMRDRLLLRRGETYLETKEYDRAEADFRAVLKVNFVPDGHADLALLHFTRDHRDLALSELALTLKRDPKNALAFSLRGRIELTRQQHQRALEDCQQAVALTPPPNRAPNAERCIETARQALAQPPANAEPSSGKPE